jgi:DnaJ-class molecular chaperone
MDLKPEDLHVACEKCNGSGYAERHMDGACLACLGRGFLLTQAGSTIARFMIKVGFPVNQILPPTMVVSTPTENG